MRGSLTSLLIASMFTASPAFADDPKTVGLAAGVGLAAASGKNSVSDNGGIAEAAVLNTEGVLVAGAEIRRLAMVVAPKSSFLVLGHGDAVDFAKARFVDWKLTNLEKYVGDTCPKTPPPPKSTKSPPPETSSGKLFDYSAPWLVLNTPQGRAALSPTDLTAAVMTDIDVKGLSLSTDDRMLVDAVLMGSPDGTGALVPSQWYLPGALTAPILETQGDAAVGSFRAPSDLVDLDVANATGMLARLDKVAAWARDNADCKPFKGKVAEVNAFVSTVTSADKDSTPPIIAAAQINTLTADKPLVLRVAVEQNSGTAVTRSNIWYSLGAPGAIQVSAGLIVSFRLTKPTTGQALLTGYVRCMIRPTSMRNVKKIVEGAYDPAEAKAQDDRARVQTPTDFTTPLPPAPLQTLTPEQRARQLVTCGVAAYTNPT
ncbi:MAG: hypothetical protein P0Y59_20425 [Candidatus Sphingomonas phytovorans]|nr:hypothetical protein [Sphingomonas sp.]WEJ99272.1 MAG: hypothetical protein P0Y59_20425 [Sphingomonas sp.]